MPMLAGIRSRLFMVAATSSRGPLITAKLVSDIVLNSRPMALELLPVLGSKKAANEKPICRPMISPAISTEASSMRQTSPMASPIITSLAISTKKAGSSKEGVLPCTSGAASTASDSAAVTR